MFKDNIEIEESITADVNQQYIEEPVVNSSDDSNDTSMTKAVNVNNEVSVLTRSTKEFDSWLSTQSEDTVAKPIETFLLETEVPIEG